MTASKPTLWQIEISHFSEKARWALAYKGVEHKRHSPLPGTHIPVAMWLTRGSQQTFPVLALDGRNIGDSTAIIAALESRYPDPALYPADPQERRRALELEDFFDEELGPNMRLVAFHALIGDPERFGDIAAAALPAALGRAKGLAGAYASFYTSTRFGANNDAAAERARVKVLEALDRLDAELDAAGGDYLVGDSFSVADLTAASLFYPLVGPEEGPTPGSTMPDSFEEFREPLRERPGY
ncbi:MAG TPA: glutathione S-transferase family protein, partial [Solirubrobacterales bacterium]